MKITSTRLTIIVIFACAVSFIIVNQFGNKQHWRKDGLDRFKETPLWNLAKAIRLQDTLEMKSVLEKDKDLNIDYPEPKFGYTLLMQATENNWPVCVKFLLDHGADLSIMVVMH